MGGALTMVIAACADPSGRHIGHSQWAVAAVMGVLALASWVWPVVVYRDGESEAFNTDDGFFVILALLVPPLLTLTTLALAFILAQAARRRSFVKSAFNTGQVLTAAGLGLASSRALAVPSASLSAAAVAAVLLGVGVYFTVNSCLVAGVVISMGTTWQEFTDDLLIQVTLAGAGALGGVILALAIQAHLWALALAIPGVMMERRLISARFAALHDRARMEGLYEVTLEANRRLRRQAVLDTILASARRLLRSPEAILTDDDPGPGHLAAPMTVGGRRQWLVASGRRRDEPFDDADSNLLRALAAVGSGALSNAELYQQVHIERERLASITLNIGEGVCAIDEGGKPDLRQSRRHRDDRTAVAGRHGRRPGQRRGPRRPRLPARSGARSDAQRPHRPGGRRPVPEQERRHHPRRLYGVGGHDQRQAVRRGDRLPRHHRAQSLRG